MQTFGLRTHAWNTALRSILLLAGFPLLLAAMGYALALLLVAGDAASVQEGLRRAAGLLPTIIPAAILLAGLWFAIAWFAHTRILDFVTGARRITDPRQEPRLWRLTETLCISRGMPLPRLSVIETPARNAYAAGLTRRQASVTVTRGLIEAMDDRELSAVLAHELSHIRNGDARLGVIAAVFVGVITLVTDPVWRMLRLMRWEGGTERRRRSSSSGGGKGRGGGSGATLALIAIAVVIAALAHLLAIVLRMALSRNREYLADAGAVEMTQDADAMISALRKVAQLPELPRIPDQVRALFLHDAALSRGAGWFATHPPIDERVAALVRFASGRDPGPLPAIEAAPVPAPTDAATEARSPFLERLDAMAHFAQTKDPAVMQNQALRENARRAGQDPDAAAPPQPRRV
ncbi:M48 family metalloprotease [Sabulicella glaciei]|uniref:M48 family metalloprotease n=1 Tax=Sabulicella glaciei TaxID=2984948 RepID=A0ABT3NPZ3_9PROT|nr:M48 family metalloprotease [Roseococcus sp. MDT2-1-1]MCW8084225.1 M48 family metalloprotease [Roseococcus sp. MDT2-1-1]